LLAAALPPPPPPPDWTPVPSLRHERLAPIGIEPVEPDVDPATYAEVYRLARQIREAGHRGLGFVPADDETPVTTLAVQLTLALADATSEKVALFDANIHDSRLRPVHRPDDAHRDGFATCWLDERSAIIVSVIASPVGARSMPKIEAAIARARAGFGWVLVDFSRMEALGEHRRAYDLVEGVVLVARAGKTRDKALVRRQRELPPERDLGVLLVG
ncbi:MAG: hypothetical protein AAGN82_10310, partial [Myxococcota bacterium]